MLLAFYAVDNSQHYGRHEFDCIYDKYDGNEEACDYFFEMTD